MTPIKTEESPKSKIKTIEITKRGLSGPLFY